MWCQGCGYVCGAMCLGLCVWGYVCGPHLRALTCTCLLELTPRAEKDVGPVKEQLCQSLFDHIPVGVGSQGIIPTTAKVGGAGHAAGARPCASQQRNSTRCFASGLDCHPLPPPSHPPPIPFFALALTRPHSHWLTLAQIDLHWLTLTHPDSQDLEAALEMGMDWSLRWAWGMGWRAGGREGEESEGRGQAPGGMQPGGCPPLCGLQWPQVCRRSCHALQLLQHTCDECRLGERCAAGRLG